MTILPKKKAAGKDKKSDSESDSDSEHKAGSHAPLTAGVAGASLPPTYLEERSPYSSHRHTPDEEYYGGGRGFDSEEVGGVPSPSRTKQYGSPVRPSKSREWDSPEFSGYNSSEEYEATTRRVHYDAEVGLTVCAHTASQDVCIIACAAGMSVCSVMSTPASLRTHHCFCIIYKILTRCTEGWLDTALV